MRRGTLGLVALLGALSAALAGCGRGSLDGWVVEKQPQAPGDAGADGAAACRPPEGTALVDILFVVDASATMCEEHAALAAGFEGFVAALGVARPVDVRVAVTTTNVEAGGAQGRFSTAAATEWPETCFARRAFPAHSDRTCLCAACAGWDAALARQLERDEQPFRAGEADAAAGGRYETCLGTGTCVEDPTAAAWVAEPPDGDRPPYNWNGSPNGACRLRCATESGGVAAPDHDLCEASLPAQDARCVVPEGDAALSGCLPAPPTAGCPAVLPAVLPAHDAGGRTTHGLEDFRCLAVPPTDQSPDAGLEQGLRAAWEALGAETAHADQVCDPNDPAGADAGLTPAERRARCARVFLRDGAALVVVFVSDEDDCSVAEGARVAREDFGRCAWLGDADNRAEVDRTPGTTERPLVAVPAAAARLRAVAPDPSLLYVVALTGDVLRPDTAQQFDVARSDYLASVVRVGEPTAAICLGERGKAALGLRYGLLADELGSRGFPVNLCSATAFGTDLAAVGEAISADLAGCGE